ncbi:Archaeal/vacuolar-type H+-ATPase subunit E (plasmid) [Rubrobacter radiotolerans]|uniref:Archaeal/vacuolar-type H+-ATPase subunit E n=1 Tax=Rubrobacter radiotolerans TaxID=42256 RepID=A0A023X7B1_RUBRA|nr:V-type ATP synthase subunit E [Rubrobacter radiotolerans]AHY48223.1 Archaeal/vacuolar-type H+-ATPase subunit E [Rubrobacter radiotolerans]MDX5895258.1 V-type ATP synthase subunit E [Rubrobacter radiotolerans]SMC01907.1 V/A-type H+-transporting ATPase subunit E [Rubrobacter radiotolerans DSM 5868]
MPLRDLLNALESEAAAEAARLRRESEAEAEKILAEARAERERTRREILTARSSAAYGEANRRLALARLEATRLERNAREEAFDRLLAEARTLLAAARSEPGYRKVLDALLGEALTALPDAATVRVHPDDAGLAEELVAGKNLAVVPDPDVDGGVVIESADGRCVRNTPEERLLNAEPNLRMWYGERLARLEASVGARAGASR